MGKREWDEAERKFLERFAEGVRAHRCSPRCEGCGRALGQSWFLVDSKRLCRDCDRGVLAILRGR